MKEKYSITIYNKTGKISGAFAALLGNNNDLNEYTIITSKSYNQLNWTLENTDALIIDQNEWAPDTELLIKRFKARNVPIIFYSDSAFLSKKLIKQKQKFIKTDERARIKKLDKIVNRSYLLVTSIPELVPDIDKPKIILKYSLKEKTFKYCNKIKKSKELKYILLVTNRKKSENLINEYKKKYKNFKTKIVNVNELDKEKLTHTAVIVYDLIETDIYYDFIYFSPILYKVPIISTELNVKKRFKDSNGIFWAKTKNEIFKNIDFILKNPNIAKEKTENTYKFLAENFSQSITQECFETELNKFIKKYQKVNGLPNKKAAKINFAEEMKSNNRKHRLEIFPFLKPDKLKFQHYLINNTPAYKEYILEMDYKELEQAYKESKRNRQPKIYHKFAQKLLKKRCTPRICKMINNICKNPEFTVDEILFYIIKDIPQTHRIFKNEEILGKYIKEFCDLSYLTDKDGYTIFQYLDYNKQSNRIFANPDTYNIRLFLTTAYSKNNYDTIYKVLELCKNNLITKNELSTISYLLKNHFINTNIIEFCINKKLVEDFRFCFRKIKENDLKKLVSKDEKKILEFLKSEKNIKYEPKHFFINIDGYGKNENWGKSVSQICEKVSYMIMNKEECFDVITEICFHTRQNAMITRRDKGDLGNSAVLRYLSPNDSKHSLITKYDYKSRYGGRYSKKFRKFKDAKKALHSPHKDLCLTRIKVNKKDDLSGTMMHVHSALTAPALIYAEKLYKKIIKYQGKNLTPADLKKVTDMIAESHWIIAHNAPWGRGSDSIANIYIKAILRALNIKVGPLKRHISLDLEAFCTELKDYKENYPKYYTYFKLA